MVYVNCFYLLRQRFKKKKKTITMCKKNNQKKKQTKFTCHTIA